YAAYGPDGASEHAKHRTLHALRRASVVTFEADATRALYETVLSDTNLMTVRYRIDVDAIDEHRKAVDAARLREERGLGADATGLLCRATFEPRKAQALLISAFLEVEHLHPGAVLVLLGSEPGPYADGVIEMAERAGLGDRIRLESLTDDPYSWYSVADA